VGKADRTGHKVAKAGVVAKKELAAISKQVEALKKQLQKTTKRLKPACVIVTVPQDLKSANF
jgi:hypothetical protein